jgi:hypothetical protein
MLLATVIVVFVGAIGLAVAAAGRKKHLTVSRTGSLHLPPMHWNQSGLRRQRGRSRNSRNRRSRSGDSLPSLPPDAEPFPSHMGRTAADDKRGTTSASTDPEPSEVRRPEANPGPGNGVGGADRPLRLENEPMSNGAVAIAGAREGDQSRESVRDSHDLVPLGGSGNHADGERLIVQLRDGRFLEGWRRASRSANEKLLILNIIAAFDTEGNQAPTTRADSFILRSEITSIQRIDDS